MTIVISANAAQQIKWLSSRPWFADGDVRITIYNLPETGRRVASSHAEDLHIPELYVARAGSRVREALALHFRLQLCESDAPAQTISCFT